MIAHLAQEHLPPGLDRECGRMNRYPIREGRILKGDSVDGLHSFADRHAISVAL